MPHSAVSSVAFRKACRRCRIWMSIRHRWRPGAKVFETIHCTSCHTKEMKTGTGTELAEARNRDDPAVHRSVACPGLVADAFGVVESLLEVPLF